ncbi:MAG: hypothetical protein WCP30_01955 [Mycobacteriaceae bacterium]
MFSSRMSRRIALVAGAVAIAGMGSLTACSSSTKDKPAETKAPSESSASPAPSPTEKKSVGSFTPSVKAKPAPTALPGNVITGN